MVKRQRRCGFIERLRYTNYLPGKSINRVRYTVYYACAHSHTKRGLAHLVASLSIYIQEPSVQICQLVLSLAPRLNSQKLNHTSVMKRINALHVTSADFTTPCSLYIVTGDARYDFIYSEVMQQVKLRSASNSGGFGQTYRKLHVSQISTCIDTEIPSHFLLLFNKFQTNVFK